MIQLKKILVPTDFSPAAMEASRVAIGLARIGGGEVVVVHVTRSPAVVVEKGRVTPGEKATPVDLWDQFRPIDSDESNVRITHEIVVANRISAAGIVAMLERFGCDLIVIGSHGHGRLRRLLRGSLTEEVVRTAHCPVLVIKGPSAHPSEPVRRVPAQTGKTA